MAWASGWSGGKALVSTSYTKAKQEESDRRATRKAKKEAGKAAEDGAELA